MSTVNSRQEMRRRQSEQTGKSNFRGRKDLVNTALLGMIKSL